MGDTKDRILAESLRLFSERGYGEVSIAEIADAVGIRPPSIYKHFGSKREIFDSIVTEMRGRYDRMAGALGIDGNDPASDSGLFGDMGEDDLVAMGRSLFLYFLEQDSNAEFRRMLSIGRYTDPELDRIFHMQFVDLPLAYQSEIFHRMLEQRGMEGDPGTMALEFYGPMLMLLISCDTDPSRKDGALAAVEAHIRHFGMLHFGGSR